MSKTTLIIDGDILLHRNTVAVEKDVRWDDDYHLLYSSYEDAWHNITNELERLFARFKTDKHVIALTSPNNFRKTIDPTYKGNRKGMRKPLCFARAKEQLRADYKTYEFDGLEADDVMGIFGSRVKDSIVCSADKDLKTVPCTVFDGKDVIKVSEELANYNHLYQTLVGDTADGYPGCPGVGPVKAVSILTQKPEEGPEVVWSLVVAAFEKAKLTEEDALRQARLARILRDSDWDSEKKEVKLWHPGS